MLTSWHTGRSLRSSTFYVGRHGYAMYLKITPKYFPDGTIFVGVGLTAGRFDSVLAWPFPQRIRLEVRIYIYIHIRMQGRETGSKLRIMRVPGIRRCDSMRKRVK